MLLPPPLPAHGGSRLGTLLPDPYHDRRQLQPVERIGVKPYEARDALGRGPPTCPAPFCPSTRARCQYFRIGRGASPHVHFKRQWPASQQCVHSHRRSAGMRRCTVRDPPLCPPGRGHVVPGPGAPLYVFLGTRAERAIGACAGDLDWHFPREAECTTTYCCQYFRFGEGFLSPSAFQAPVTSFAAVRA